MVVIDGAIAAASVIWRGILDELGYPALFDDHLIGCGRLRLRRAEADVSRVVLREERIELLRVPAIVGGAHVRTRGHGHSAEPGCPPHLVVDAPPNLVGREDLLRLV